MKANTKTTKTVATSTETSNIKKYAVKGYHSVIEATAHSYKLADNLVGATPTMWNKACAQAQADMDSIFAELGI